MRVCHPNHPDKHENHQDDRNPDPALIPDMDKERQRHTGQAHDEKGYEHDFDRGFREIQHGGRCSMRKKKGERRKDMQEDQPANQNVNQGRFLSLLTKVL
jgi:hypothetical protein